MQKKRPNHLIYDTASFFIRFANAGILFAFCDPAGTRTQDPNIKSVMLYRLSYEIEP